MYVICYIDVFLCIFQYYLLMQPQVRKVDGRRLINDIKVKIEKMIQKRVDAVRVSLQLLFLCHFPLSFINHMTTEVKRTFLWDRSQDKILASRSRL